ncbi:uncharacterized protein MONOS_1683 [Monocercomonoides exilis]|uniref:uncharacterized protein n=1 Tax=Monocercomonoides exilis TaxID=2049356 RepID=UPI00355997BD|nr:hypothetical protein MONOS_1683 [Monocercomonoides exilis]|eukprot:MONOS_1683.1-p1 / transcript=MONOS_1683.1 / gene=MONOS_1683 / organism=Monocercomonoides_exilis_PA203 / gene_product=unspecified product / transcript_product=unspecified product / location=Mono_scaffold00031:86987-87268(-) / protein_length=94 / sequence_SO=supercontig / SO=protein_coding / is_pseudo=false
MEPEVCRSLPGDGIQQENRRAEEAADGSFGHNFRLKFRWRGKDVKQVQISMKGVVMNEEQKENGTTIDLEKKKKEEESEREMKRNEFDDAPQK